MATIERLTITLPAETATIVKDAMAAGGYASTDEVVNEALLAWEKARALGAEALASLRADLASLRADIDLGLRDVAEGRVYDFDLSRIEGRRKSLQR